MRARPLAAVTGTAALLALPLFASASAAAAGLVPVVVVERAPASGSAEAAVRAAGGSVGRSLGLVDGFAADVPASAVARLSADPAVRSVTRDAPVVMSDAQPGTEAYDALPPDLAWPVSSGLDAVPSSTDGRGVTVAVLDTGLTRHSDLGDRVIARVDLSENGNGYDAYGHGSHMAGLVAGDGSGSQGQHKGAAPGASLVSVKVAGWNGATDVSQVLAGLEWVAAHRQQYGIRVLSLSFGTDSSQKAELDPLNHAVQKLWQSGVVVVVAAGNRGSGKIDKPGDDPYSITVGAADTKGTASTTDDTVAPFSSHGKTSEGVEKPDVVAPGISLVSHRAPGSTLDAMRSAARQGETYFRGSGTSQATAVIAGTTALMLQAAPGLTPDQAKATLLGTTSKHLATAQGGGSGLVHAGRAVQAAAAGTYAARPANTGLTRSLGTGQLDSSRGSVKPYTDWKERGKAEQLSGEYDALGGSWSSSDWARKAWTPTTWTGSPWARHTRVSPGWAAHTPGTTWSGLGWDQSTWSGANWRDSGLTPETWTGANWRGGVWG